MSDSTKFSFDRIKTHRLTLNPVVTSELLKDRNMNISTFDEFSSMNNLPKNDANNLSKVENPLTLPFDVLYNINNYRFIYKNPSVSFYAHNSNDNEIKNKKDEINADAKLSDDEKKAKNAELDNGVMGDIFSGTSVTASIFNPLFNVQIVGITENIPLLQDSLNDPKIKEVGYEDNIDDCSVKELVRLSHNPNSILGNARYRYADFMYCKDLGKISNNHLITLRKFTTPVGDQIFKFSSPNLYNDDNEYTMSNSGDIGRLISWFDTDDNKLEDILKYNYKSTWQPLKSKIQEIESKENDQTRGPLGMLVNSMPGTDYLSKMGSNKQGGTHNLYSKLGTTLFNKGARKIPLIGKHLNSPDTFDRNEEFDRMSADQNKVYTPLNTIQDTYIYEGKLEMSQDISLTFSYKMRGYDNINQKSAMLDLIGNILEVTYRRGTFWGGARKFIGPAPNVQGWNKANNIINNTWEKIGGIFSDATANGFDFGNILSSISGFAANIMQGLQSIASGGISGITSKIKNLVESAGSAGANAIKGQLQNMLGRPAMYAMDSLLSSDNVGLWHLTIGNPKNPIMAIGNLILEDASIQQLGPLGIDDFPTEIKVQVKLKHGRSRDLTEIAKMYTKGLNGIYYPAANNKSGQFVPFNKNTGEKLDFNDWQNRESEKLSNLLVKQRNAANNYLNNAEDFDGEIYNELYNKATDTYYKYIEVSGKNSGNSLYNNYLNNYDSDLINDNNAFTAMFNQTTQQTANGVLKELVVK